MKSAARPIIAATKGRLYSTPAAAVKNVEHSARVGAPSLDAQVSKLKNGLLVASVENHSPVSRVAVVYNGGSRSETHDNLGISHCLRNAAHLTSEQASVFAFVRNLQQIGGDVQATSTREQSTLALSCLRSKVSDGLKFLGHASTQPLYYQWELADNTPAMEFDLALLETRPDIEVIEALHSAAYRLGGLGNSLYVDKHLIGSHSSKMCKQYHASHFLSGNAAVVGVGVDHKVLVEAAQKYLREIPEGIAPKPNGSKYVGGEVRMSVPTLDYVHAALVSEGVSLSSGEAAAASVLQAILGPSSSIAYTDNTATSRVTEAIEKATSSAASGACINANYSDSGLFGFRVVAAPKDIGSVIASVKEKFVAAGNKDGITNKDVERGKARARSDILMSAEHSSTVLEELASDVLLGGEAKSAQQAAQEIESVTLADVQAVAKKVLGGKSSLAVVGDLHQTPYLDEL